MAENIRHADFPFGHPGVLTYVPAEDLDHDPGDLDLGPNLLHAARFPPGGALRFGVVGSSAELYPPSIAARSSSASSRLWRERRLQQRWLLNAHPEAFAGHQSFQGYLKEDMERFRDSEETTRRRPLLALGYMADMTHASGSETTPLLAVAAGQAGEQLRLTRMDESQWRWEDSTDAVLHLSVIDSGHDEDEALWITDAVPISQVKAVTYSSSNCSVKWLVVQKPTWTAVLQPQYYPHPVPDDGAATPQRPSCISPNPLLTLHNRQTGGNAHSDVSFRPPTPDRPVQLVIMDECGYWTIWNVSGTWQIDKKTLRASQYACGHISEGILTKVPTTPRHPADRHGLLHVGRAEPGEESRGAAPKVGNAPATTRPSRFIIMWNSALCEVMDVESHTRLRIPALISHSKGTADRILDIQRSPVNEDHIFVLTIRGLIWLDLRSREASPGGVPKPAVLQACSHFGIDHEETRLSTARASVDDVDTSLVFTYSSKARQLCAHWFSFSQVTGMPQWHRHVSPLPGAGEMAHHTGIQQLLVQPVRLERRLHRFPVQGDPSFRQPDPVFYQLSILGEDLAVRYCICSASASTTTNVSLPNIRINWSRSEQQRRWKKKRKQFSRRLEDAFVLPDNMVESDMECANMDTVEDREAATDGSGDELPRQSRPVLLKIRIYPALRKRRVSAAAKGGFAVSSSHFDAISAVLEEALLHGRLPLTTWAEMASIQQPPARCVAGDVVEKSVEHLLSMRNDQVLVTQLRGQEPWEPSNPLLVLSAIERQLSQIWLESAAGTMGEELEQVWKVWVSEVAGDLFLSSHAAMIQDVPLLGPDVSELDGESETASWARRASFASQSSSCSASSQLEPSSSDSAPSTRTDPAVQRLRLLAQSLEPGKLGGVKCSKTLSLWPTERGIETDDYLSSVAMSTEEQFREAKERLQRKKDKRKALSERYKRPALPRQGLPASDGPGHEAGGPSSQRPRVQIMSSQPRMLESSQTQGPWVTMSQPVAGVFGDRKKGKKRKLKSGFR